MLHRNNMFFDNYCDNYYRCYISTSTGKFEIEIDGHSIYDLKPSVLFHIITLIRIAYYLSFIIYSISLIIILSIVLHSNIW